MQTITLESVDSAHNLEQALSINLVNLVGNVGADPDVKYFTSGSVKCTLTLAVRSLKKDQPDWFNLELWGKTAEVAANYVRKGKQIGISGSLKIETWRDLTLDVVRSKPVIAVSNLYLL
jgi:single-strand DNA-binding protein